MNTAITCFYTNCFFVICINWCFTTSGFVELRAIDDNGDNFIDAADSKFTNLQVWRDLDQDGRSNLV